MSSEREVPSATSSDHGNTRRRVILGVATGAAVWSAPAVIGVSVAHAAGSPPPPTTSSTTVTTTEPTSTTEQDRGTGKVIVTVVERGRNVPNRTVTLTSRDDGTTLTKVTNAGGQAKFDDVAAGLWDVTVDGGPAQQLTVVAGRTNPFSFHI
jgi:hypothetical protein